MLFRDRTNARRILRNRYFEEGGDPEGLSAHLNSFEYLETEEGCTVQEKAAKPKPAKRSSKAKKG